MNSRLQPQIIVKNNFEFSRRRSYEKPLPIQPNIIVDLNEGHQQHRKRKFPLPYVLEPPAKAIQIGKVRQKIIQ